MFRRKLLKNTHLIKRIIDLCAILNNLQAFEKIFLQKLFATVKRITGG